MGVSTVTPGFMVIGGEVSATAVLEPSETLRGVASNRNAIDSFEIRGSHIIVTSGGIGGNLDMVKKNWPVDRLGPHVPKSFVIGVPAHVDGRMIDIAKVALP